MWLGRGQRNNMHLVMQADGTVDEVRDVKAVAVELKWNKDVLAKLSGLPWDWKATVRGNFRAIPEQKASAAAAAPQQPVRPKAAREQYLTKRHVRKYGATPGCEGCLEVGSHEEIFWCLLEKHGFACVPK